MFPDMQTQHLTETCLQRTSQTARRSDDRPRSVTPEQGQHIRRVHRHYASPAEGQLVCEALLPGLDNIPVLQVQRIVASTWQRWQQAVSRKLLFKSCQAKTRSWLNGVFWNESNLPKVLERGHPRRVHLILASALKWYKNVCTIWFNQKKTKTKQTAAEKYS